MPGSLSSSFTVSQPAACSTRRRSSVATGSNRRSSKWSIASCFSESSNPDDPTPCEATPAAAPVPVNSNYAESVKSSRRKSYLPKRAAESFAVSTTPYAYRTSIACTPVSGSFPKDVFDSRPSAPSTPMSMTFSNNPLGCNPVGGGSLPDSPTSPRFADANEAKRASKRMSYSAMYGTNPPKAPKVPRDSVLE